MESEKILGTTGEEKAVLPRLQGDGSNAGNAAARSMRNLDEWRSYLSPECIETMVQMGWDRST
jgi:hypothetical protein